MPEDILCVRIAGLCHDLGHGPFSHMFETFVSKVEEKRKEEKEKGTSTAGPTDKKKQKPWKASVIFYRERVRVASGHI